MRLLVIDPYEKIVKLKILKPKLIMPYTFHIQILSAIAISYEKSWEMHKYRLLFD